VQLVRMGTGPLAFDQSGARSSVPADAAFRDGKSFTRRLHSEPRTPRRREDDGLRCGDVETILQQTLA
jgi:hypothetical protein